MAGGVLQDAADLARVYLHSAAAGIPEWAQRRFGDPTVADATDAQVAQSKANTGFAGSVANVAGFLAPGGVVADAYRGIKMLPAAVRAAPKVAYAIPAAERAVRAVVNPGRANAYARLGLGEVPTATGALGQNMVAAVKAHPILTGLGAIGIPGLALADYAHADTPAAAAAAPAKQAEPKAAQAQNAAPSKEQGPTNALDALIGAVAASQGGKISLNQLAAIGDFTAKVSPDLKHPPTYKDKAAEQLTAGAELQWQMRQNAAKQMLQQGADPADVQKYLQGAIDERNRNYATLLGQDPQSMMLAQRIANAQVAPGD